MQIAIKFDETVSPLHDGTELVLFRAQMLRDVFFHERDPLPELSKFLKTPLTRPREETYWVYRQGTYIPEVIFWHGDLFVGYAYTKELDDSPEPTFEGYHHVKTLFLEGGGLLSNIPDVRYTMNQQIANLTRLYDMVR